MARDAISAGDRVAAEAYYQYAEHYYRIVNSSTDPASAEQPRREGNGRDADAREDNGAGRQGRHEQAPRGQDARRGDESRNRDTSRNAQPAQTEPGQPEEDREGLARVLGKDGEEPPQAGPKSPPDREAAPSSTRRRSRQRPAGGSNNGEASQAAQAGTADDAAPDQQEAKKTAAPREKDQDTEPAGA